MQVIHDKRGRLTAYGFACGYVERFARGTLKVQLWREHGLYHVQCHDRRQSIGRPLWLTFETLVDARKHFSKWKKIAAGYPNA